MRRLATPTEKTGKLIAPRKLHNTTWGIVCPAETPEGGSVGVVKNLAITTTVTNMTNSQPVYHQVINNGLIPLRDIGSSSSKKISFEEISKYGKIFINGNWIGLHEDLGKLRNKLKSLRRMSIINIYTSIYLDIYNNELYLYTDGGRCCRPLLIVDSKKTDKYKNHLRIKLSDINKLKNGSYKWRNLILKGMASSDISVEGGTYDNSIKEGLIEFVDVEDSHNIHIVKFIRVQFLEFWHQQFLSRIIINLLETHINLLWVNRQWEFIHQISIQEWIH